MKTFGQMNHEEKIQEVRRLLAGVDLTPKERLTNVAVGLAIQADNNAFGRVSQSVVDVLLAGGGPAGEPIVKH